MKLTLVAWKYFGTGIDGGRVLYHRSRKWWVRIGPYILSAEFEGAAAPSQEGES